MQANVNKSDRLILIESFHDHIRNGNLNEVEKLLKLDSNLLKEKNKNGFPPITIAAYNDQFEIAQFLLEQNADVNARDNAGNTPLMAVCFKGYEDIADLFLIYHSDINAKSLNGSTALMYSVMFGQPEITALLLKKGADPSLTDNNRMTALMHAENSKNVKAINILKARLPNN